MAVTAHGFAHKATTVNSSHYFEERVNVRHCSETTLHFPMLPCCSRAPQLRHGAAYAADLSQAAWRLFRPFLGRWNIKRDPAGYTSNVIRVQHTTERHRAAHARLLIPGTLSYRQPMPPETVCLMKPAKQWIQCKIWRAVGQRSCGGLPRSKPIKKAEFYTPALLFTINAGPWIQYWFDTDNSNSFSGRGALWISWMSPKLSFSSSLKLNSLVDAPRANSEFWLLPLNSTVFVLKD